MALRPFGRTGLMVSPFAMGTMEFGSKVDETEASRLLNSAVEAGVNCVDTHHAFKLVGKKGSRGGNLGRGPLSGLPVGDGLRAWAGGERDHRNPQALRRIRGIEGGPQPCAGEHGSARVRGPHPPAVRARGPGGPGAQRDELLHRRRRDSRRLRPGFADRPAPERLGLHGDGGIRLRRSDIPAADAPDRRD